MNERTIRSHRAPTTKLTILMSVVVLVLATLCGVAFILGFLGMVM